MAGPAERGDGADDGADDGAEQAGVDSEPTTQRQMLPETTQPLLCDDGDTHAVEDAVTADEEPAPAAVRPLGRLGGDDGGWALALDYRSPPDDADASESTNESAKEEKEAERLEGWLRTTGAWTAWEPDATPEANALERWGLAVHPAGATLVSLDGPRTQPLSSEIPATEPDDPSEGVE